MSETAIFKAIVNLSPDQRTAFLDQACRESPQLREEIESLLRAHDASAGILANPSSPAAETSEYVSLIERSGTVIGPYRLMEQIGEGGFGLVFVAEQQQPVRRRVALKIIKPGMDTRDVVARFEAERQALALMDHPNIARVFDGGATDSGRPYFVMELVKGVPITDYCDLHKLTARERIQLFISVCHAVQHAHSKGIIHRDLKPSNILVSPHDGVPVVKVIDFGIAKAIGQQLTDKTVYTRFAQMIGTPLYMSPEQAEVNALDVDIRSDIYSLGVLLYELLTGTTPFDRQRFCRAAVDEIRRIIREEEPPPPSTRLSTMGELVAKVSIQRNTAPDKLSALLKGDLDWVVMKALEKDRSRRYETTAGLAKDLLRYLADEPVDACPPSTLYRVRKFVCRHRAPVAVAVAMVGLLGLGLAGTLIGLVRARQAAEVARIAQAQAVHDRDLGEIARKNESTARRAAQQERDDARSAREALRRTLYSSNLNLLQVAWEANHTSRVLDLLQLTTPQPGEQDLRGFEWHYWDRLCHPAQQLGPFDFGPAPAQPRGDFTTFSDDGRFCAAITAGTGPTASSVVKLWDTASGREMWSCSLDEPGAVRVAVTRDGRRLAVAFQQSGAGSEVGKILFWNIPAQQPVATLRIPSDAPPRWRTPPRDLRLSWSNEGRRLVAFIPPFANAGTLPSMLLWELEGKDDLTPITHPGVVPGAAFSPDGTQIATLGMASMTASGKLHYELRLLDAASGKVITQAPWPTPDGPQDAVAPNYRDTTRLAFSPNGTRVAAIQLHQPMPTGRVFSYGIVWDSAGKVLTTIRLPLPAAYLCFSQDGGHLATWTGERNPVGHLWNASTGELIRTWKGQVVPVISAAFNQDGMQCYTLGLDGRLFAWDATVDTYLPLALSDEDVTAISADGSRQCRYNRNSAANGIRIRDAAGQVIPPFLQHEDTITGFMLSGDGQYAVSSDRSGTVLLWEVATGKVLLRENWPKEIDGSHRNRPSIQFSANSRRMVIGFPNGVTKIWDIVPVVREVLVRNDSARSLMLDPNGNRLAVVSDGPESGDGRAPRVTLWDVDSGKQRATLTGPIHSVLFSPDGQRIAGRLSSAARMAVNATMELKVWKTDDGAEVLHVKDGLGFGGLAFSPDGSSLAAATRGNAQSFGDILVWNLADGTSPRRLTGHGNTVTSLAYTPDGRRIVSAAQPVSQPYGEIKFWDAVTCAELLSLQTKSRLSSSHRLSFSRDGHRLLVIGNLGVGDNGQQWDGTPRKLPRIVLGNDVNL